MNAWCKCRLSCSHSSRSRRLSGISCDKGIQGERGLLQKPSPLPLIICQSGLTGRGMPSHGADHRPTCAIGFGQTEPEHLTRERKRELCCTVICRRSSPSTRNRSLASCIPCMHSTLLNMKKLGINFKSVPSQYRLLKSSYTVYI